MKASAIIRIVIWSIVLALLVGVLVMGLTNGFGNPSWWSGIFNFGGYSTINYADSHLYSVGGGAADTSEISAIEVHWISGNVTVERYDGDRVIFDETSGVTIEDAQRMRYRLDNGKLIIQFAEAGGFKRIQNKDLTIRIPSSYTDTFTLFSIDAVSNNVYVSDITAVRIDIETVSGAIKLERMEATEFKVSAVSGDLTLDALTAGNLGLESVSGRITLSDITVTGRLTAESVSGRISGSGITAEQLKAGAMSGDVDLTGSFARVESETVSGRISILSWQCPSVVKMETVSGNLTIKIPDNEGFTASYSTLSGNFSCQFDTQTANKRAVHKSGAYGFEFSSVSGGISIERIQ